MLPPFMLCRCYNGIVPEKINWYIYIYGYNICWCFDVSNFLNTMGADIRGAGTDTIKINGVKKN